MAKSPSSVKQVTIHNVGRQEVEVHIMGTTPFIYSALSFKNQQQLLKPSGRKTASEKATTLKHDPYAEYVDSVYARKESEPGPTRLLIPCRMFKSAMADVAKNVGAETKSMKKFIGLDSHYSDLYGVPQLFMTTVRDAKGTPDIRTRAIVSEWATTIIINWAYPAVDIDSVFKLLSAAGQLNGVGDFRREKGAGDFGSFCIVNEDDGDLFKKFKEIKKKGIMKHQDQALSDPDTYDRETERLLGWFKSEVAKSDRFSAALRKPSSTKKPSSIRKRAKLED